MGKLNQQTNGANVARQSAGRGAAKGGKRGNARWRGAGAGGVDAAHDLGARPPSSPTPRGPSGLARRAILPGVSDTCTGRFSGVFGGFSRSCETAGKRKKTPVFPGFFAFSWLQPEATPGTWEILPSPRKQSRTEIPGDQLQETPPTAALGRVRAKHGRLSGIAKRRQRSAARWAAGSQTPR